MTYTVCIPSYNRAALCKREDFGHVRAHNIAEERIYVHVASQEEYDRYKDVLDASLYGE